MDINISREIGTFPFKCPNDTCKSEIGIITYINGFTVVKCILCNATEALDANRDRRKRQLEIDFEDRRRRHGNV